MRKFFCILGFLSVGLMACSGCHKKDTSTPVCTGPDCTKPETPDASELLPLPDAGLSSTDTPTENPDYLNYSGDGWKLTAPFGWDMAVVEGEEVQPELVLISEEEHSLVLLNKDIFPATTQEYVLVALQGMQESGAKLNSTTQVELNGNKFVVLDSEKDGVRIWIWVGVKNGVGYNLSCGGPANEDHHEAICKEIASTLKI